MKLKVILLGLAAILIVGTALPTAYAGPTSQDRQQIQQMINRGDALRHDYEKERSEFIESYNKWNKNQTEENRQAALGERDQMKEASRKLKANRDSVIAKVDSTFDTDEPPGTDVQYDPEDTDYGYTSSRCFVRIGEPSFKSPDEVASTKIHEFEHVRQKAAGLWGPGNTPQACTYMFHKLEFEACEAELDADFGKRTTLCLEQKLEILESKLKHLEEMVKILKIQFDDKKITPTLPGRTVETPVTVANTSNDYQNVSGYFTNQLGWYVYPQTFGFSLASEQETTFALTIEVPPTAELGTGNEVMCHAYTSGGDSASAFFFIHVIPTVDVISLGNVEAVPGVQAPLGFTVTNEGTAVDSFMVDLSSVLGWPLGQNHWLVTLEPSHSVDLMSSVLIGYELLYTTDLITCRAASLSHPDQTDSSWTYAMVAEGCAGAGSGNAHVFALLPNLPNPFSSGTMLRFSIPSASPVDLKVFDVRGRLVRTLLSSGSGVAAPGIHTISWDGTDDYGRLVASGVYFSRLEACRQVTGRKLVILR
ncbi:MAG: FlgD immunoglobulin-like domain containing protein [Candidatus Eisenbacteria bacterium]